MPASVKSGGTWKTITNLHVNDNGTWKEALGAWRNQGGSWVKFHGGTGGSFVPFTVTGFTPSSPMGKVRVGPGTQTQTVTVLLSGGSGSFTYSWAITSNDAGGSIIAGGSSAAVTFQTSSISPNASRQTVLTVTVTDTGDSNREQTGSATINWEWTAP
jgi:hypothetical protein